MKSFVEFLIKDKVGFLTLNRPERFNAIGLTIAKELRSKLLLVKKDLQRTSLGNAGLKCLVIQGVPNFSKQRKICFAGGDLKELATLNSGQAKAYAASMAEVCLQLETLPIPVITTCDGLCIGGGIELFLAGDLRIATSDSQFYFKQLELGLSTGYGSSQKMLRLFGQSITQFLLYTCANVSSEQSKDLSITHILCKDTKELKKTLRLHCERFKSMNAETFESQKYFLLSAKSSFIKTQIATELVGFEKIWRNPNHQQQLDAFTKKLKK